jgi:hypothetical protein
MIPQNLVSHTILFASANMYFHTQIALSCQNVLYALYFYFVYIVEEILINYNIDIGRRGTIYRKKYRNISCDFFLLNLRKKHLIRKNNLFRNYQTEAISRSINCFFFKFKT